MKTVFRISGLSCQKCVASASERIQTVYTDAEVTLQPPRVMIVSDQEVAAAAINELLENTGFSVASVSRHVSLFEQLRRFAPLICMLSFVTLFAIGHLLWVGEFMQYFMAGYFLLFGGLKVVNWKKFVPGYRAYDPVARASSVYAWSYPALEFGLGVLYYTGVGLVHLNVFVFVLMLQKAYGVHKKLQSDEEVQCACLGGFFSIPVTHVTFFEDLMMAAMAAMMLV